MKMLLPPSWKASNEANCVSDLKRQTTLKSRPFTSFELRSLNWLLVASNFCDNMYFLKGDSLKSEMRNKTRWLTAYSDLIGNANQFHRHPLKWRLPFCCVYSYCAFAVLLRCWPLEHNYGCWFWVRVRKLSNLHNRVCLSVLPAPQCHQYHYFSRLNNNKKKLYSSKWTWCNWRGCCVARLY